MRAPPVVVLTIDPEVIEETARFVVVAAVVVEFPVTNRFPKTVSPPFAVPSPIVEEAKAVRPPLNCVRVDVALPASENGYDPPPAPLVSSPQVTFPFASVVSFPPLPNIEQLSVEMVIPSLPIRTPANVDVPVVLRRDADTPPEKVEVEFVPDTVRNPWNVEVPVVLPWIVVVAVVPMYILFSTDNAVDEAFLKTKSLSTPALPLFTSITPALALENAVSIVFILLSPIELELQPIFILLPKRIPAVLPFIKIFALLESDPVPYEATSPPKILALLPLVVVIEIPGREY